MSTDTIFGVRVKNQRFLDLDNFEFHKTRNYPEEIANNFTKIEILKRPRDWAKTIHMLLNTIGLLASWSAFGMVRVHQKEAYGIKERTI